MEKEAMSALSAPSNFSRQKKDFITKVKKFTRPYSLNEHYLATEHFFSGGLANLDQLNNCFHAHDVLIKFNLKLNLLKGNVMDCNLGNDLK